jgi:uncharacterized membrane protein
VYTRQLLIVVSVFGVAATLLAMLEGAWLFALAIYGLSIVGLCALLRRAARRMSPAGEIGPLRDDAALRSSSRRGHDTSLRERVDHTATWDR